MHEDDYSLWQALTDTDQGGQGAGADALPACPGAAPAVWPHRYHHADRGSHVHCQFYGHLYLHHLRSC